MMSRWPSVVSRPTLAPLRSSRALVATVVPCTMRSVPARSGCASMPSSWARSPSPSMTPIDGSSGVEADLAMVTRPFASTATRSVKVPPTSTPMRYMSAPSALPAPRAVPGCHEAVLDIGGARGGIAAGRFAPAAAARGHDVEDGAGRNGDAHFLRLEDPALPAGDHDVAMRQAVLAAEDAVGRMTDAIACRIALGRLGRLHAQGQHRAHPAADPPATPAVRYRPTSSQPVEDRSGHQAPAQTFRATRALGGSAKSDSDPTPTTTTTTTTTAAARDTDGDG